MASSPDDRARLHGFIQKAYRDATEMPWRTRPAVTGAIRIEKFVSGRWRFVCAAETQEEAEDFLVGKLTQEDR